jgi:hypothetical protein
MEVLFLFISIIAAIFLAVVYGALSWGYVAHTLYLWFVQPHFTDLPMFSLYHFIGFMLFSNVMFKSNHGTFIKEEFKDKTAMYSGLILNPWITLFVAWIIKSILL